MIDFRFIEFISPMNELGEPSSIYDEPGNSFDSIVQDEVVNNF